MKKEIYTVMVLITPEIAREMLKLNISNRPLNSETVNYYARQMTLGQWTLSGQTISISDANTLIDGQHRLAALVKSGRNIMFNVAYNVPFNSFLNYDNLRPRGVRDVFAIEMVPNYADVSALISKYRAFTTGNLAHMGFGNSVAEKRGGGSDKAAKLTNAEALALYNTNQELFQGVVGESNRCYGKIKLFTKSQIGAFMYYLIVDKSHPKEKVFSFFNQLFFNENVENVSIYNLREKLINGSIGQFVMVYRLKYIFLVKCWNAFIIGKEIKVYSFNNSEVVPSFL
jgi:hypothetical protein